MEITKSFNSDNNLVLVSEQKEFLKSTANQNIIETMKEVARFLESNSLKNIQTPLKGTCLQITKDQTRAVFSSRAVGQDSEESEGHGARLGVIDLMSEEVILDRTVCKKDILTIALSNDDQYIYAGGSEYAIFKFDLVDLTKVATFIGHSGTVKEICISSDDSEMFSASEDGTLRMWYLDKASESVTLVESSLELNTLDLSSGSDCLVTGGKSGVLYFYEFFESSQGKIEKTLDLKNAISACKISANHSFVTTGDELGNVKVFKFASWELCYEFSMSDQITDIDLSFNEDILIAGSKNTNIKIWFLIKKKEINYNGHSECVQRCTFMKDNSRVVSISDDKNIKIWKIPEPEIESELFRQEGIEFEHIWFSGVANVINGVIFENSELKSVSLGSDGMIFKSFAFSNDPEAKLYVDYSHDLILSASSATSEQVASYQGKPDQQSFLLELVDVNQGIKVKSCLIQKSFEYLYLTPTLDYIILAYNYHLHLVDYKSFKLTKTFFLNQDVIKIISTKENSLMFILGINQLTSFQVELNTEILEISENDDKKYEDSIEDSSLYLSKNSRLLFLLTLKFCEIIHCKSFQTISKLLGNYSGFFENINKTFFLYSQNLIKIYSIETFEHLTTIRKDFVISKIFLSSDFSQMFIKTSEKIIKAENPLKTSKLTLVGDYTRLERFQLCINSLFDRELETDIAETMWLIEPVHVNLLHVFAYLNQPKLIIDSIHSQEETPSFINSRGGYSALAVALKMNFIDCVDSIVKLLIKKLKESKSDNNIIAQFMFKVIENDINELNVVGYSRLHKLYNNIFTVDNSVYLPNFLQSHVKLPLMLKATDLIIDTHEFELEEFDGFGHMNSVVFKKTVLRLYLEMGSSKSLEFLKSLAKCSNLKVFETRIISVVLKDKWLNARWAIFSQAGLYFGYLVLLALYSSNELSRNKSFLVGGFVVSTVLYAYEIVFIVIDIAGYFKDFWNIVDTLRFFFMFSYCMFVWSDYFDISINKDHKERYMLGILLFISWMRGLTYFRMVKATRYLVNLLFKVIIDITPFLVIIFYSFLTYSLAFRAFSSKPQKDFFPFLTESYMIIIGEWENPIEANFYSFIFLTATLLNPIISLNLLIAIISKTFLQVKENQVVADSQELVEMIIEIETLMVWKRNNNKRKYLHLMLKEINTQSDLEIMNLKIRKLRSKVNELNSEMAEHDKIFSSFKLKIENNSRIIMNAFKGIKRGSLR